MYYSNHQGTAIQDVLAIYKFLWFLIIIKYMTWPTTIIICINHKKRSILIFTNVIRIVKLIYFSWFIVLEISSRYRWLRNEDILCLPVKELLAPEGLVAIWVTNKRKLVQWVTDVLLPHWGLVGVAEWTWLKVARSIVNKSVIGLLLELTMNYMHTIMGGFYKYC